MSDDALPPERALPPPAPWKLRVWVVVQLLAVQLPLTMLTVSALRLAYEFARGVAVGESSTLIPALACALAAAPLAWLSWRCARKTRAVWRGWEPLPPLAAYKVAGVMLGGVALFFAYMGVMMESMFRNRYEGSMRGNLGAVRSALSIYYGDLEGAYPEDLRALTVQGKYLTAIPKVKIPVHHWASAKVHAGPAPDDAGGWYYNNVPGDANIGTVLINCTHTDVKGSVWTSY